MKSEKENKFHPYWVWTDVEDGFPNERESVLIKGLGEDKQHYVYCMGFYREEIETACKKWVDKNAYQLWFEPIAWMRLP